MSDRFRFSIPVYALAIALAGCGGGDPLESETALGLIRDRNTEPVKVTFSATPKFEHGDVRVVHAYQRLMDAHILECHTGTMGTMCQAGPTGTGISQSGSNELAMVAGHWVPASILSVSRSGRNAATADVRLTFEAAPLYAEFEPAFDQIQTAESTQALASKKEGRNARAAFQHSDDGWHLESIE